MALNLKQIKRHAKEYVELEAHTKVISIRFFKRYELFGNEDMGSSFYHRRSSLRTGLNMS